MRRKLTSLLLAGTIFIGLTMCAQDNHKSKNNITDERDLPVFTGVEAGGGIDVYIMQGEPQKVFVVGNEEAVRKIVTEVSDDILNIYFEHWTFKMRNTKVLITMKDIKNLKATGGSDIYSKGQLVVGNINIDVSGGSDADLDLKAIEITGSASGGSDILLKGAAGYLKLDASGGSDCKAYDLTVAKASVSASGGSDIFIKADEEIRANASGGSDIHYKGNARITNIESSGGSHITRE